MASQYTASLPQVTTLTTTAAETTIVTADANFRNDLALLVISVTTGAAAGTLTLRNVTGGGAVLVIDVPTAAAIPAENPIVIAFPIPAQGGGLNQNWTIQSSSASNSFRVSAFFVKGA